MAKRYGGKFSPDDQPQTAETGAPDNSAGSGYGSGSGKPARRGAYDGARAEHGVARTNVLFIPAVVLVFTSLNDGAIGLSLGLLGAGLLTLAAWLTREGIRAQAAYDARKVARRPAFPRKIAASLLTGLGIGTAAFKAEVMAVYFQTEPQILASVLYAVIGGVLHQVAFGPDPLKDKGMEGIDTFQQDRVARVVDEAEAYLTAMRDAIKRAGDRETETRVDRFQTTARDLFRTVEEDPRDLTGARKYLTVYLMGARDATIKFADIYGRSRDAQAKSDYLALLDDLEQNFAARTRKMLLEDRSDLTVEIDVLRERLQREGVRLD